MSLRSRADAGSRATTGRTSRLHLPAVLCALLLGACAPAPEPRPSPSPDPVRKIADRSAPAPGGALLCTAPSADPRTIDACRVAVAALPTSAAPRRNLAMLLADRGDHALAAEAWRGVLALEPEAADAWLGFARALAGQGRREDALVAYEAFARLRGLVAPAAGTAVATAARESVTEDHGLAARPRRSFRVGPTSSGSGVVVTRDGAVLTNKHVVRGCRAVKVQLDGAASVPAEIRALDAGHDLALLSTALGAATPAAFRASPTIRPGDDVVAVGFPLAGLLADQVNVTRGSVNALAGLHNDQDILQMDAAVQPGSSGGPLFDLSGNVVGIVVTKLNAKLIAEEMGDFPQNVNFAIKERVARDFLDGLGIAVTTRPAGPPRSAADVGEIGRQTTVLVECYR